VRLQAVCWLVITVGSVAPVVSIFIFQAGNCFSVCPLLQALSILAEVEGAGFARRAPTLLPLLAELVEARAAADAAAAEAAGAAAAAGGSANGTGGSTEGDLLSAAPGWQEAYYSLLLLQKLLECAAAALAWAGGGPPARRCWRGAQALLLHRHAWVRKAAARLVGAGLAAPDVAEPWLAESRAGAAGEGCLWLLGCVVAHDASVVLARHSGASWPPPKCWLCPVSLHSSAGPLGGLHSLGLC
jgi:hypothetical protein